MEEINVSRKQLFESSLSLFSMTYESFAKEIKRDRATVYRVINNLQVKDNKYVNHKINCLINKFLNEIEWILKQKKVSLKKYIKQP